jgi:LacI family transcriptional regulator
MPLIYLNSSLKATRFAQTLRQAFLNCGDVANLLRSLPMSDDRNDSIRRKKRIAVMMPLDMQYTRQIVLGAAKYCVSHGLALFHMGWTHDDRFPEFKKLNVEGLVGYAVSPKLQDHLKSIGIPVVNTSSRFRETDVVSIWPDHHAIGRAGAIHLIERGFRQLAYCGIKDHYYSEARSEGFIDAARAARVQYSVFQSSEFDQVNVASSGVARDLTALPRPLGVMCCNDIRSRHVLDVCNALGFRVPQDVAIVGVDNDEVICQGLDPTLSSADPNAYRVGYDAVAVLERIMQGKGVPDRTIVPPLGVVPRGSSNTTPSEDARVGRALEFIHANADRSINVLDVARRVGTSRRTLERHFRGALGKSVAHSIRKAHVELAKQLLIDTDLSLEEVAESAGMNYLRQMRIVFTKDVGISPSQFRKQFKGIG